MALLAAAGFAAASCDGGPATRGTGTVSSAAASSVAAPISADPPVAKTGLPESNDGPVAAFLDLARASGADERTLIISRCTMEMVEKFNGRGVAELLVRAKRAELARETIPQEAMPALGVMLQAAEDCTRTYDEGQAKK